MKKEKIITRTIESTVVNYKVFIISEARVADCSTTISGKLTEKDCTKVLADRYENNDTAKFIMVESVEAVEKLYGMPESLFMTYATELPPRKVYEKEEV